MEFSDFMGISLDGTIIDYEQFKKANEEYFAAITNYKFVTLKEYITILEDNLVLHSWQGSSESILKTDEKMTFSNLE